MSLVAISYYTNYVYINSCERPNVEVKWKEKEKGAKSEMHFALGSQGKRSSRCLCGKDET